VPLGGVEGDVVDAEPSDAADDQQRPLPASASAPGEKSSPTPRIATKADAQASSVTTTARMVRPLGGAVDRVFTVGP
jgi:hypothetical protein